MGQTSGVQSDDGDTLPTTFSLERAQAMSSNPVLVGSRYHSRVCGKRGRCLHDDFVEDNLKGGVLGKGSNVEVMVVRGRDDGKKYALKSFVKENLEPMGLGLLANEVEIYLGLDHPHIVRLEGVYETDSDVHIVMECCEGGELFNVISTRGALQEEEAARAAQQLLRAVGYLHAHGIAHRDVKLENLLYEGQQLASPLKLGDFGLACAWGHQKQPQMKRCCGSMEYVSPEVLREEGYTCSCDLWGVGVITFMLLGGYAPFPPSARQKDQVLEAQITWHAERWDSVSAEAIDFVQRLLVADPTTRMDVQQAIFHPWLLRTVGNHVQHPTLGSGVMQSIQRYAVAPLARRMLLQLLVQHLSPEERTELRESFLGLDLNNEGIIRIDDLRHAVSGQNKPSADWLELFEAIEYLGKSAGVHYSEFLAAASQGVSTKAARLIFDRMDTEGKGTIGADDLAATLGQSIVDSLGGAEQLLAEADVNGDFSRSGCLSFCGFCDMLRGETEDQGKDGLEMGTTWTCSSSKYLLNAAATETYSPKANKGSGIARAAFAHMDFLPVFV